MRLRTGAILALCLLGIITESSRAAIIQNASGRRRARPAATVQITTTTTGQRQIKIIIDPDIPTAFQLDLLYPEKLAEPVGFGGFNTLLPTTAIEFIAPYVPATNGIAGGQTTATILPPLPSIGGLISNIEGVYSPLGAFSPTLAPLPDTGTDLFAISFIDLDPTSDKVFTVLGVDETGVPPELARYLEDNFIDIRIDDPSDPLNRQVVRIGGDGIERLDIFVPGVQVGNTVPLPAAVWAGVAGGVGIFGRRLWRRG